MYLPTLPIYVPSHPLIHPSFYHSEAIVILTLFDGRLPPAPRSWRKDRGLLPNKWLFPSRAIFAVPPSRPWWCYWSRYHKDKVKTKGFVQQASKAVCQGSAGIPPRSALKTFISKQTHEDINNSLEIPATHHKKKTSGTFTPLHKTKQNWNKAHDGLNQLLSDEAKTKRLLWENSVAQLRTSSLQEEWR